MSPFLANGVTEPTYASRPVISSAVQLISRLTGIIEMMN